MAAGNRTGVALKFLQWFIRGVQFCCAAVILAIFSYFLATLSNHNLPIATWIRAVEGISGAAVLYTLIGLLLLCCLAGHAFASFIAIFLDICFVGAFVYLAVANRQGASSCRGHVDTPFGSGNANSNVYDPNNSGWTALPSLREACRMQTACLAVAIVGILFFLLSALVEVALVRHHRKEKRFGPGPANDYTGGYGSKRRGLFGFGRKRNTTAMTDTTNTLPAHSTPADVRDSYATEQTRVGTSHGATGADKYNKYGETAYAGNQTVAPPAGPPPTDPYHTQPYAAPTNADGYQHTHTAASGITGSGPGTSVQDTGVAQYPPGNYRYDDGTYNAR
jgi:hypothetical protein